MGDIEDIALDLIGGVSGGRPSARLSVLRAFLTGNYLEDAAQLVLDHPNRAFILTGFYIPLPYVSPLPDGGSVETDGPPGSYFLGEALRKLGWSVTYVSDKYCTFVFKDVPGAEDYVEFPVTGWEESEQFARGLLAQKDPTVVFSVERPGVTINRRYLNSFGWDLTEFVAKLDPLVDNHPVTVGVGDGGNEIGMGNFAVDVRFSGYTHPLLMDEPTVTRSTRPVLGYSSDWGCYGLVTALSKLTRRDLLPTGDEVKDFIRMIVDRGVVTGSGRRSYTVDGRSLEEHDELMERFRAVLKREGVG